MVNSLYDINKKMLDKNILVHEIILNSECSIISLSLLKFGKVLIKFLLLFLLLFQ